MYSQVISMPWLLSGFGFPRAGQCIPNAAQMWRTWRVKWKFWYVAPNCVRCSCCWIEYSSPNLSCKKAATAAGTLSSPSLSPPGVLALDLPAWCLPRPACSRTGRGSSVTAAVSR
ncbi:hypothetical protein B0H19DRAFT_1197642 [Mycena capillaripes]|nr:hypothetical protein B0H19DRAFT_1197642 [Mycena capillaripes]